MSPSGTGSPEQLRDRSRSARGEHGAAAVDADDREAFAARSSRRSRVRCAPACAARPRGRGPPSRHVMHCPFLASRDRVKGTARVRLAAGCGGRPASRSSVQLARTCTGPPRSGNGSSTRSKSRGTIVRSNTARASSRSSPPRVARREVGEREQPHLGLRAPARPPARAVEWRVSARALGLLGEEGRLVHEQVGAVRRPRWSSRTGAVSPASTTLRPRRVAPEHLLGRRTPPTVSPRWRRPKSGPGATPSSLARGRGRSGPGGRPPRARSRSAAAPVVDREGGDRGSRRARAASSASSSMMLHLEGGAPDRSAPAPPAALPGRAARARSAALAAAQARTSSACPAGRARGRRGSG